MINTLGNILMMLSIVTSMCLIVGMNNPEWVLDWFGNPYVSHKYAFAIYSLATTGLMMLGGVLIAFSKGKNLQTLLRIVFIYLFVALMLYFLIGLAKPDWVLGWFGNPYTSVKYVIVLFGLAFIIVGTILYALRPTISPDQSSHSDLFTLSKPYKLSVEDSSILDKSADRLTDDDLVILSRLKDNYNSLDDGTKAKVDILSNDYAIYVENRYELSASEIMVLSKDYTELNEDERGTLDILASKYDILDGESQYKLNLLLSARDIERKKEEVIKEKDAAKEQEELERAEREAVIEAENSAMDINYRLMYTDFDSDVYSGKHIRLAGLVNYVGKNYLNINDGIDGSVGYIHVMFDSTNVDQLDSISKGDYVIVTGDCGSKIAGQIPISKSNIEDTGESAKSLALTYKDEADSVFAGRNRQAESDAHQNMLDFKKNATTVDYEDLVRNSHKYEGVPIVITLDITQAKSGGSFINASYTGVNNGNEWKVAYKDADDTTKILNGDTVKFYGVFDKIVDTSKLFSKSEIPAPRLSAMYSEIQ